MAVVSYGFNTWLLNERVLGKRMHGTLKLKRKRGWETEVATPHIKWGIARTLAVMTLGTRQVIGYDVKEWGIQEGWSPASVRATRLPWDAPLHNLAPLSSSELSPLDYGFCHVSLFSDDPLALGSSASGLSLLFQSHPAGRDAPSADCSLHQGQACGTEGDRPDCEPCLTDLWGLMR